MNVVNQPAGAGAIAAEKVASARKDGYTLLGSSARPSGDDDRGQSEGPGEFGP